MIQLYNTQKLFLNKIRREYADGENFIERVKDYCLGINKNVADVLEALDWDPSKEPKANSRLHQKIETLDASVDIIKYALNLCVENDVDDDELTQHFNRKHRTVEQKLRQKQFVKSPAFKDSHYAFIIDIDGVIADIIKMYKNWFGDKTGLKFFHFDDLEEWRMRNIDKYKELKEEYRLSGAKMIMPMVEGARQLLEYCHSKGIVSLLSNRPVKRYPIIYMYTVEWLLNTGLMSCVDMIHFIDLGEKRYFFDRFEGKEVYFFEDNAYNVISTLERPNVCNLFIRNEANENIVIDDIAIDCDNLLDALNTVKELTFEENQDT